jgi:hypothetical protein
MKVLSMTDITPGDFSYLQQYSQFTNREDFWNEVIAQLNKDLGDDKAIITEQANLRGEHGAEALVIALQKYLPAVTPRLSELLYRIDLGEKHVASLKDLPPDLYYRCLSEMVLKRVIQKVMTRKLFSGKKLE